MTAFGMFVAAMISNERIAAVGAFGCFFLQTFFQWTVKPYDSTTKKMFIALLPAPAFQMTFDSYLTLDASGVGCTFSTANRLIGNFSVERGILMLFFDIIIW